MNHIINGFVSNKIFFFLHDAKIFNVRIHCTVFFIFLASVTFEPCYMWMSKSLCYQMPLFDINIVEDFLYEII